MVHSKLLEILKENEEEIKGLRKKRFRYLNLPKRDFSKAISKNGINLIAEIKFASPSAGKIRDDMSAVEIAKIYDQEGVSAISVLTEKRFFKGDIGLIPEVKRAVSIPILRKDFILDPIQIEEAKAYGADAVLLISRILSYESLRDLIRLSKEMDLSALVEVHDEEDIKKAIDAGAEIIGINNRDLSTFHVDINTTIRLLPHIPEGFVIVSESGIEKREDIELLEKTGRVNAVLVGTSIMKSKDIRKKIRELSGRDAQV